MDKNQILVPARTYVYLAPVGTTAPEDATTALDPAWKSVGFTTPDSLSFSTEPEFQEVTSAQSDYPTLRFQTSDSATLAVTLQQWNAPNFQAVYGGGTIEEIMDETGTAPLDPPQFKFVPPKIGEREEKAAIVETIFGAKHYRIVFPRAMQLEGVQMDLQKSQEAQLPLSLGILGGDLADPWYLVTDDPAFDPTGL
jgi:hypothetical protein